MKVPVLTRTTYDAYFITSSRKTQRDGPSLVFVQSHRGTDGRKGSPRAGGRAAVVQAVLFHQPARSIANARGRQFASDDVVRQGRAELVAAELNSPHGDAESEVHLRNKVDGVPLHQHLEVGLRGELLAADVVVDGEPRDQHLLRLPQHARVAAVVLAQRRHVHDELGGLGARQQRRVDLGVEHVLRLSDSAVDHGHRVLRQREALARAVARGGVGDVRLRADVHAG